MDKDASLRKILLLWCLVAHHAVVKGSKFNEHNTPYGLNKYKVWWAKEITPDYYVSGQLTERQIKYAFESGFKSILSLYPYGNQTRFGIDIVPSTRESKAIAEQVGMDFAVVMSPHEHYDSVETVEKFSQLLRRVKKPVILECHLGFSCTLVLLVHLANVTRHYPLSRPTMNSSRLYDISADMGYFFQSNKTQELVAHVTGEPAVLHPPIPNTEPPSWLSFWLARPVYMNWYISGQITRSHVREIIYSGFRIVFNLRMGAYLGDKPNQEEVNLLNIRERTGTYATVSHLPRQNKERLEETRVDPNKPNSYISPESDTNYESKNRAEFGDAVGYNEADEKTYVEAANIDYYHFPICKYYQGYS